MGGVFSKIPMASKDGTRIRDSGGEWRTPIEADKTRYPRMANKLKVPDNSGADNNPTETNTESNNSKQNYSKPTGSTRLKKIKSVTGLATKALLGG